MKREEAISIVRGLYRTDAEKEALQTLIPKPAESEDENVREELMVFVSQFAPTHLKIKYMDWLEKQKENPKSIDSIPSNCASDVRCGDRWHNVKDSLPDSPREVLCKDAIGNYFIGRYYSKGLWEVSMYDDCDKSNEDNPPVVMWIDIPSEKQKEQKFAEWSEVELEFRGERVKVKRAFYRDDKGRGYSTTEQDQDVAWAAFRAWCEKKGISFYSLYPREEWSEEDKRRLLDAIYFLESAKSHYADTGEIEKTIAWLKSLKPQPKAKLTLLDENIIDAAVAFVGKNDHFNCWRGIDKHTVINALRSLKSHWKPSEEQMKALKNARYMMSQSGDYYDTVQILDSLINDLKKLM